jgi:hypothetical protein
MSLTKSPANNFGSGSTNFRVIVATAAAALIGVVVGGVSVLGIVVAVTQPPNHEIRSDAAAPTPAPPAPPAPQATPPQTAPTAERQSVPAVQAPRTVWPDALSARTNHGSDHGPETESPASPQASPPRNDQQAASPENASNQNEDNGIRQSAVGKAAATPRGSLHNQSPNTAPARRRVVASPPPPAPSTEPAVGEAPAANVPMGKARGDVKKSQAQLARQKRAPDDQSDQAAYPPQRRVIVLPGPDQAASDDRGHWGGGLFDFFGDHRYNDRWNDDHDWHGSGDWHD